MEFKWKGVTNEKGFQMERDYSTFHFFITVAKLTVSTAKDSLNSVWVLEHIFKINSVA